jgi:DNA-binding MarR family transcriptional regulator
MLSLRPLLTQISSATLPSVSVRLTEPELRAWQALLHAHHDVTTALDSELRAQHGLSMATYDVLLRLARAPDRSLKMSELADRVMMSPSGLTRAVDRLVTRGLVKRERSADDARVMLARVTEQGRRVLRLAARTHLRGIRERFTGQLTRRQLDDAASALEVVAGPHKPH